MASRVRHQQTMNSLQFDRRLTANSKTIARPACRHQTSLESQSSNRAQRTTGADRMSMQLDYIGGNFERRGTESPTAGTAPRALDSGILVADEMPRSRANMIAAPLTLPLQARPALASPLLVLLHYLSLGRICVVTLVN